MLEAGMNRVSFKHWLAAASLAFMLAAPGWAAAQSPFSRIVVFGTSLSDPGNLFVLLETNNVPPDYLQDIFMVPNAPYARGGHHLTNGATWIEQLARPLGLAGSVRPALRGGGATNFAVAGTRAFADGINMSFAGQVGLFLQALGLVWNSVPDIGMTPAVRILDSFVPIIDVAPLATALAQNFSTQLEAIVAQLDAMDGAEVARLDVFKKVEDIVADPTAFGLTNLTMPCITPSVAPFTCRNPDEYLFWDGVHPTRAVHAIFAQEAAEALLQ
jgi:phospholipase/lecithinase/hemolysin